MRQRITYAEGTLRRDRLMVLGGLVSISALAWAYLISLSVEMGTMEMAMEMAASMQPWTTMDLVLRLVMWAVLMIAMMVPTATAMILAFATINCRRHLRAQPYPPTAIFLGGYVVVWTGFSALATLAQWALHEAALLSPLMASTSPILGGLLLLTAGGYQWTPLKYACLKHCRSSLGFRLTDWREGRRGALNMGLRHGLYCTGCCGFLMTLLFVAGVMNLLWVATMSLLVLVEKVVPRGDIVGRVAGGVLAIAGLVLLGHGFG
jgi:predicted metal-binding membrane protein